MGDSMKQSVIDILESKLDCVHILDLQVADVIYKSDINSIADEIIELYKVEQNSVSVRIRDDINKLLDGVL